MNKRQMIRKLQREGVTARAIADRTDQDFDFVCQVMSNGQKGETRSSVDRFEKVREADELKARQMYGVKLTYAEIAKSRRWG